MSRAAILSVELPKNVRPTDETSEQLIRKFLKECSKESLLHFIFENSAMSRRFTKKSVKMRQKRINRLRNSQNYQKEIDSDPSEIKKKKKKKQEYKPKIVNE